MAPQIVLISGCSTGIGLSTAIMLATDPQKRFKVYATMRNLKKKAQLEEAGKDSLGATLLILQLDVCSDDSVNRAVSEVIAKEGRIDVLINNAGMGLAGVFETIPIESAKQVFEVNFFGASRLIRAVLPDMKKANGGEGYGYIVNVSSVVGTMGFPCGEYYSASKFAMTGLTESLAPLLDKFNIRISLVEPGPVKTAFGQNMQGAMANIKQSEADEKSQNVMKQVMATIPISAAHSQTGDDIAGIIQQIILTDTPQLRYGTNEAFESSMISAKLVDPTGNKTKEAIDKFFFT